ncbi:molybdopterin-dependent oxidoreductase [Kibdelosporangium phytohabitans]|uniref:Reductase n=1 Tax=Kibdelosporangium phytohabitans TaxID=860235 RepID=A0A0N9I2D0_9PSEU|nr:molybdopterin-dependent oxidoreductase [Kibdelosporangium phytohabitans]ALG08345.1 reductase [Kibdelosporangium phytohabitans]MBE1470619.1 DMSO/TMAO reductase YedYZ molybdopterin-dependent catalytic subunit [Kibdelosporangium phytohabitans]
MRHGRRLPPGQRPVEGFPRFGTHLSRPAPAVPADPVIEVRGAVTETFELPLAALSSLPRKEISADFHCVAGWTATDLRWEGVSFATFYRSHIEPVLTPGTSITHVACRGLDGWQAVVTIDDILGDDVLIAQNLHGLPLDSDHGAPARLVSPSQYGYISVKHLCRVELLTTAPANTEGPLLRSHPRGRVWHEERHGLVPGRVVRPVYRALIRPIRLLSARGASPTK